MNSQEFVQNAIRTESIPETLHVTGIAQHATMCAIRSVGDFVDIIKKAAFYNKPIDAAALEQSMDDVMFRMGAIVGMAQHGLLQEEAKLREHAIQTLEGNEEGRATFERNQKEIQERMFSKRLFHAVTGIVSESGEMAEALLKSMEDGTGLDLVNFAEELFDVDWYMAIAHDEIKTSQDATREKGIAKLKKRYADKFTADEAINRDVVAERAVLEGNA
jgi:NTP pyrophosphatase (non-canonical NTP hydrolase)